MNVPCNSTGRNAAVLRGIPLSEMPTENAAPPLRPLCVDLDGSLVKSDTLLDGLWLLARRHPAQLFLVPFWLARGRAALKIEVASRAPLDVAHLPYNATLLRYLQAERSAGRPIYLATGADGELANRVAAHLGI